MGLSTSERRRDADAVVEFLLTSPMYFCEIKAIADYVLTVFSTFQNGGQGKSRMN